jgi:hypothetical protein
MNRIIVIICVTVLALSNVAVGFDLVMTAQVSENIGGGLRGLDAAGKAVFVPTWSFGLLIYNVADPAAPYELASLPETGGCSDIDVVGNLAYLACGGGLKVVSFALDDINNPTVFSGSVISYLTTGGGLGHLSHQNGFVYARRGAWVVVIDVADPYNPVLVHELELPSVFGPGGIDVSGARGVVATDRSPGIGGDADLWVLDLTDPQAPFVRSDTIVGGCGLDGGVELDGTTAFVTGLGQGLEIYDVTDLDSPAHRSSVVVPCSTDVFLSDSIVLATSWSWSRLYAVDVADPANPVVLDSEPVSQPLGVVRTGNVVVAASSYQLTFFHTGVPSLTCAGFEPPLANGSVIVRGNRALPIKGRLFGADGNEVTDLELTAPPVLQVMFQSTGGGATVDVTDDALPAGFGTEGNEFEYNVADGIWQYNLKTKDYSAAGTYTITMVSGDDFEYTIDPTCEAGFEKQE